MFTSVLCNCNYQACIGSYKNQIKYYGFHQTLGHFRQQNGAVCGKWLN